MLDNIKNIPGLMSLQTVLETNRSDPTAHGPSVGDDDFELWDQSAMLRSQQRYKWNHHNSGVVCKPSCIPICFILILIVLVVLLPLLDTQEKFSSKSNFTGTFCHDECRYEKI